MEALDGSIGKVDDAHTTMSASSFIVVDTGKWIFGKKVMLPAGVLSRVDLDTETVFVNRTKDEIKNAPGVRRGGQAPRVTTATQERSQAATTVPASTGYREDLIDWSFIVRAARAFVELARAGWSRVLAQRVSVTLERPALG